MRLLRAATSSLARLLADLILVSALLTAFLWFATRNRPLSLDHNAYARGQNWHASLRLAASRGGLWILHLTTRPPDTRVPLGLGGPHYWTLHDGDAFDPDARLSLRQTGPRRLGFASRLREDPRRTYAHDPRTNQRVDLAMTERERITRIPFAAIVAALLVAPITRIALATRRRLARRRGQPADAPRTFPIARRCFDLATLASTLLLGFAITSWIASRKGDTSLSCTTQFSTASFQTDTRIRREILWSSRGWEISRAGFDGRFRNVLANATASRRGTNALPPQSDTPQSHLVGLNLRDDLLGRALSPGYAAVGGTSGDYSRFGFAYAWEDTPIGPVSLTYAMVRVTPAPPGLPPSYGMQRQPVLLPPAAATARRTATSFTIPHWAVVLLFATVPLLWCLRFRLPLRRYRRRRRGLCPDCGYDLRATPDHCPECGHHAPHPTPAPTPTPIPRLTLR
jgi:hypothetical protein